VTTELFSFQFAAMASDCAIYLYAESRARAEAVADAMQHEAVRIEARYSRYRQDSVLSEINRAARLQRSINVDEETARLIDYAYAAFEKSDGLFDITSGGADTRNIHTHCVLPPLEVLGSHRSPSCVL